ncbi:N-acetylgalactosamine kinase [Dermatophagoides farinae]|nr:N-acetylgalactosamine kinase-like [Dermatophagoides farinae]XP_046914097.1 N-acetylgalactosamine kinase-like [Dermatophagoides farinae]KAH9510988.1 N-acetylgalactosamine kinase [Dermatophagoides farinae]
MSFEDSDYISANIVPVIDLPDNLRQSERVQRIFNEYKKHFGSSRPLFLVRVPGRVNLIGEHIDYCGYSVLPMAVVQDIMMAVGPSDSGLLHLANFDNQYPEVTIEESDIEFPKSIKWYHYFLCGYKGIVDKYCIDGPVPSMNVLVHGTIPAASGLSSSSAMVCASALSTLISYHQSIFKISTPIPKLDIALLCTKSERYIGTDSGGMDQAIAMLAEEGSAKIIDFIPQLNATNVDLPEGVCWFVAHCGVSMQKAATAHYNTRVAETRLAAAVIARRCKIAGYKLGDQLWVVQQASAIPLAEMGEHLASILDSEKEFYTKSEICSILGIDSNELHKIFLSRVSEPIEEFKLYQRAKHVYEEAYRVQEFRKVCDTTKDVEHLGQLMIESHESCRDLYECSSPQLDELVALALENGAIGSRLTGAGWGGCTVSLVYEENAQDFESALSRQCKFLCRTNPSGGAIIYQN